LRGQAQLTVETANQPGRVHRTLDTTTPRMVPPGPIGENETQPAATRLPIGAVLRNGGELTNVQQVVWTAPPGTFLADTVRPIEDFSTTPADPVLDAEPDEDPLDDATDTLEGGDWHVENTDTESRLVWEAASDLGAGCGKLSACSLAASVLVDGRNLTHEDLWPRGQLTNLYAPDDLRSYVDWFVRTNDARDGVPHDENRRPGFGLADRQTSRLPGPAEGSYTFSMPPTSSPVCTEEDIDRRDRATRDPSGERAHWSFEPDEDGLAHVGDATCLAASPTGRLDEHTFTLVGHTGNAHMPRSVGQASYTSSDELDAKTVARWNNGLAESRVTGPDTVRAGETAAFTLHVASLYDTLLYHQVGEVTIDTHLSDPYNAWEEVFWMSKRIVENEAMMRPGTESVPLALDTLYEADNELCQSSLELCAAAKDSSGTTRSIEEKNLVGEGSEHDPVPSTLTVEMPVPEDALPGTHLFVAEVQWEYDPLGLGDTTATVAQTGRLIVPVDVLTPEGYRAQATLIGGTAWAQDWEEPR